MEGHAPGALLACSGSSRSTFRSPLRLPAYRLGRLRRCALAHLHEITLQLLHARSVSLFALGCNWILNAVWCCTRNCDSGDTFKTAGAYGVRATPGKLREKPTQHKPRSPPQQPPATKNMKSCRMKSCRLQRVYIDFNHFHAAEEVQKDFALVARD
jgi:hypothetical protein